MPMHLILLALAVAAGPGPDEGALARRCGSQIPWITDGVELEDGSTRPPSAPAEDRIGLLERAKALAREKNRLILWYCPRVPGKHMYRAAVLDTYAKVAFFTDPGVVELVKAKFVPLRAACDEKLSAATGLGMPSFVEPGIVLLSPEGRVVHTLDRIRTFNAGWLRGALVRVLRKNPDFNAPAGSSTDELLRGGDDEAAVERGTPDQRALALRYAGRFRQVLELPCAPVHRGAALLGLGDLDGARSALGGLDTPEALYYLAAVEAWSGRDPGPVLRKILAVDPSSPWAWRAAANLVPARDGFLDGPLTHLFEDFGALPPQEPVTSTREPSGDLEQTARRAVEFLLRAQREDGTWSDARYSYGWAAYQVRRRVREGLLDPAYVTWPDPTLHPNLFMAQTALAAQALAEWRSVSPARVDRALARAERVLADDGRIAPGRCEECFAEAFRLLYWATKVDVPRMNRVVTRLARLQDADGFWGHEYPSAFATAAIVHILTRARGAGADVPEVLLGRAADALLKSRRDGGTQDYRYEPGKPPSSAKNSAGRTAICELALNECGRGPLESVAAGVRAYWAYESALEAVRSCDNHADGELAGFFYSFAAFQTLEAACTLGGPDRAEFLRKFRDQTLARPEVDGSFEDSHELGKSYGTAVALLMLRRTWPDDLAVLDPEERPRRLLYRRLEARCDELLTGRRREVAAIKSPDELRRRQVDLREKLLAAIGPFPERTPLNVAVLRVLSRDGYRIENLVFESRPRHHVPGNLYVPQGKGPFPGILFPLGHYGNPRAAEEYQRTCILLAKHGFVVLTYDPPGQGERHQLIGAVGRPGALGTTEHTLIDCGALLTGACAAQYFIWDGMRGLDLLAARPEVDATRLGCLGNSGGGTMTAYLMALDERVACAVPNCFVTSLERLYATVGPQDGEANLPGQVAIGLDHPDFLILRAPRPVQLSCPTRDYYDIEGAWTTFREAKVAYGVMGHAERADLFEWDAPHSISRPGREAALRWMRRWLGGVDDSPVEADFPIASEEELRVTKSGEVVLEYGGKTLYDFTAERAAGLEAGRRGSERRLAEVRRLIGLDTVGAATVTPRGTPAERPDVRVVRRVFDTEPGIRVPALTFIPKQGAPRGALLYVHGEGKAKEAGPGGAIERWAAAGYEVTAIDLRGMGETGPEPPHKGLEKHFRADWKEAYLSFALRRPLLGQRVGDLLAVRAAIDPEGRGVHVVGVGAAAPVALHAAALEPLVREVTLEGMVVSWTNVARTPLSMNQLTNVVPGALAVYDLPDLAASLSPRPLTIRDARDAGGVPVSPSVLEKSYAEAIAAYASAGAAARLRLSASDP